MWNLEWDVILGLRWMKNFHTAFDWNINGQHYLCHNKEYLCTNLPQNITLPIVHCASTVCIAPRSAAIILKVKVSVVLDKKKLHHLVSSDDLPERLILLDVSHRVSHKHPKNLIIPVLNSKMEKVSMTKSSILGQVKPLNINNCKINETLWSKLNSYTKTFNNSMLSSTPHESEFQPNPSERHQQPILQDDINVPQEARDCLNATLKNNFQSIVSQSSTDIARTKLFEMDSPTKGPPIAHRTYPLPLKYQKFSDKEIKLVQATGCISKILSSWAAHYHCIQKIWPKLGR